MHTGAETDAAELVKLAGWLFHGMGKANIELHAM